MPKFHVHLQSQTDDQARYTTLSAADEAEARAICEANEASLVAYKLDEDPYLTPEQAAAILDTCALDENGKVCGGTARQRGKFHAHQQELPYTVVSVTEVA